LIGAPIIPRGRGCDRRYRCRRPSPPCLHWAPPLLIGTLGPPTAIGHQTGKAPPQRGRVLYRSSCRGFSATRVDCVTRICLRRFYARPPLPLGTAASPGARSALAAAATRATAISSRSAQMSIPMWQVAIVTGYATETWSGEPSRRKRLSPPFVTTARSASSVATVLMASVS
jgi:hypothetical protein